MPVRLKDIAQQLGISTVTVSKVLRGMPDVGERTRALVLERMKELNYRPNMVARGLASGRSFAIGLIVPDLIHPFFGEFATHLGSALRQEGLALMVSSSEEDPDIEQREILALIDRGIDALLLASCQPPASAQAIFAHKRTPVLLVDRNFPDHAANFVGSDDVMAGKVATEHLLSIGRRRIAHIGVHHASTSIDRLRGYREALAEAAIPVRDEYIVGCERFEESGDRAGYEAMRQLLRAEPRPDAVFCYNDLSAVGAMHAAMEAGLRIPRDIAFVGCGNFRYAQYLKVPLSSIDHSTEHMGTAAAKLALQLIAKPDDPPQLILLKPKLIVRASSVEPGSVS